MKTKQVLKFGVIAAFATALLAGLVGCGGSSASYTIAVPSDTTNEARALLLLQDEGIITLKGGVGLEATKNDIAENPYNVEIVETEAAALPRTLQDVDFAVINGNYALSAGLDPEDALVGEDPASEAAVEFANIIAVRADDTGSEKTKVLVEALQSADTRAWIAEHYQGAVVPVEIDSVFVADNKAPADKVIKVGASPAPHAEILEHVKPIIEAQGYTLEIIEYSDYIQPNVALNDGDLDANYFQHYPYLEDYNAENGTNLASAGKIHFEPLCIYGGKLSSLDDLKK